jgi:hypothetical protein
VWPLALYSDRHSIFGKHGPEDPEPTQFERAARQLGIEPIQALAPQAKGRVERAFQTLHDRWVKALRLAGCPSIEEANELLPGLVTQYNERLAKVVAMTGDAHRRLREAVSYLPMHSRLGPISRGSPCTATCWRNPSTVGSQVAEGGVGDSSLRFFANAISVGTLGTSR